MSWGRAASSHQNRTSYTTTALLMQHQQYRNQTELLITLQHAGKLTNKYRHNANTCPLWLHTHWAIVIHDTDAICWSSHVNEKKDDDKPTEADGNHGSVLNWRLRSSMEQLWHPKFLTKGRGGGWYLQGLRNHHHHIRKTFFSNINTYQIYAGCFVTLLGTSALCSNMLKITMLTC